MAALWPRVAHAEPDHHFALRFYPVDRRAAALTLMAFTAELRGTPARVSEPMIGEIRLQWWRDAVEGVFGEGRLLAHPVVEAMKTTLPERPELRAPLDRMINETARFFEPGDPRAIEEAIAVAAVHDGGLATLLARLLTEEAFDEATETAFRRWGASYGLGRARHVSPVQGAAPKIEGPIPRLHRFAVASEELRKVRSDLADVDAIGKGRPVMRALAPVSAPLKLAAQDLSNKPLPPGARYRRMAWTIFRGR